MLRNNTAGNPFETQLKAFRKSRSRLAQYQASLCRTACYLQAWPDPHRVAIPTDVCYAAFLLGEIHQHCAQNKAIVIEMSFVVLSYAIPVPKYGCPSTNTAGECDDWTALGRCRIGLLGFATFLFILKIVKVRRQSQS